MPYFIHALGFPGSWSLAPSAVTHIHFIGVILLCMGLRLWAFTVNSDPSLYFARQMFIPIGLDPSPDPMWPCSLMEGR